MKYEKISGFTDEISSHLEQQLIEAGRTGISYLALRNIDGKDTAGSTHPGRLKGQCCHY